MTQEIVQEFLEAKNESLEIHEKNPEELLEDQLNDTYGVLQVAIFFSRYLLENS